MARRMDSLPWAVLLSFRASFLLRISSALEIGGDCWFDCHLHSRLALRRIQTDEVRCDWQSQLISKQPISPQLETQRSGLAQSAAHVLRMRTSVEWRS